MFQKLIDKIWTAPLAGVSDSPFRVINRRFGAKNLYSEMISVEGLWRKDKKTKKLLNILAEDRPLIIQLFGSKPESFYSAVKEVESIDYVSEININSGCPVRKVVRSGSGSALMKDPILLASIISSVRKATDKKISIKIRSGWDMNSINAVTCAKIAENEGVDIIIVHPRTASQMFMGSSDWSIIKSVKEYVNVPVIGNGDVWSMKDAQAMIDQTACDGVMVGRALVGNPWFFKGLEKKEYGPEYLDIIIQHMELSKEFYDESKAFRLMKKHLIYYVKGLDLSGKKTYYDAISKAKSMDEELCLVKDLFMENLADAK
jgi:tRNA-dihydrouridine synthase B